MVLRIRMRSGLHFVLVLLLVQPSLPALARTKPRPVTLDRDYASALAAADRFLHAWQTQDAESGLLLLTDRVRQHTDENQLRDFFSSERSLSPGFEVGRGKKLSGMRYQFPVALFPGDNTHPHHATHPQASALIVVRIGRDDWAIDKLP
jgi:hypothetical protein